MKTAKSPQLPLGFKASHGGKRKGAGRKKVHPGLGSHAPRPAVSGRQPVHVTLHVCDDVYRLRSRRCFAVICAALAAAREKHGLRVIAFNVEGNHLHLIVEPDGAEALSRGMQGLAIRLARGLNRLQGRRGPVFRDRFFAHVLRTPREVRAALAYVLRNTVNHFARFGRRLAESFRDRFAVGFFGTVVLPAPAGPPPVSPPRTWLLREGWRLARPALASAASRAGG